MDVPFPAPERVDPPFTGSDEHAWYEAWLDHHRDTLLWKCSGLDGEQLCLRSVPTTTMTLLGIVRHMTEVERDWFRNDLDRQGVAMPYSSPAGRNDEFDAVDPARAAQDVEAYRAEILEVKQAAARHGLDDTFDEPRHGPISLRWLYLHMLEEYARHNGHADLLREAIDGETGE